MSLEAEEGLVTAQKTSQAMDVVRMHGVTEAMVTAYLNDR
jgi:hypothetical protein